MNGERFGFRGCVGGIQFTVRNLSNGTVIASSPGAILQGELVMVPVKRILPEPNGPAVVGVVSAANTEAPYIIPAAAMASIILLRIDNMSFG